MYLKGKYDYLSELFSDERIARYEQYDVLQWILKYGDNWPEAQHWCDALARENGFKPREHSDFLSITIREALKVPELVMNSLLNF